MASWLVCSTPDRVVRVRVLAGDIVLCSWARHLTLTVPLLASLGRAPVAQLVEHRAVMREVAGSNPGRINTQDLKITEEKVLPL